MSFAGLSVARWLRGALVLAWCSLAAGCYDGPGPKEPPPGSPGGFCLAGNVCNELTSACDPVGDYCYDKANPCRGVFCGDHGLCILDKNSKPACACEPGYSNEQYTLYCEPYGE